MCWSLQRKSMFAAMLSLLTASFASSGEPLDVVFTAKYDGSEQRFVVVLPAGFEADKSHSLLIALQDRKSVV